MPRPPQTQTVPPPLADATAEEAAGALQRARDAWGEYLHAYEWDHFVTLTYERPVSPARAARDFTEGFVRRVAFEARRPLAWFFALERDGAGERVHIHALVAGTSQIGSDQLRRAWKGGNRCVRRYAPHRGAAYYVTKTVLQDTAWYDMSRRLPPRRRVV